MSDERDKEIAELRHDLWRTTDERDTAEVKVAYLKNQIAALANAANETTVTPRTSEGVPPREPSGFVADPELDSGSDGPPPEDPFAEWSFWEIETVDCVVCPGCAFTFDQAHTDTDRPGLHSCPICESRESPNG